MKYLLFSLSLLIAVPASAEPALPDDSIRPFMIAAAVGQLADNISTQWSIDRSIGNHETNPLLPDNHLGNATLQGMTTIGTLVAMHIIGKHHPRLARIIGVSAAGIGFLDTGMNIGNRSLHDSGVVFIPIRRH